MAIDINQELDTFQKSVYGKDMRASLISAFEKFAKYAFCGTGLNINSENKEQICGGDLNNLPNNSIYGVASDLGLTNSPSEKTGVVMRIGKTKSDTSSDVQFFITIDYKIYMRGYWNNTWREWKELTDWDAKIESDVTAKVHEITEQAIQEIQDAIGNDVANIKESLTDFKKAYPTESGAYDTSTGMKIDSATYVRTNLIPREYWGTWLKYLDVFGLGIQANNFISLFADGIYVGMYGKGEFYPAGGYTNKPLAYTPYYTHFAANLYSIRPDKFYVGLNGELDTTIKNMIAKDMLSEKNQLTFPLRVSLGVGSLSKEYATTDTNISTSPIFRSSKRQYIMVRIPAGYTVYIHRTNNDKIDGGTTSVAMISDSFALLEQNQYYRFVVVASDGVDSTTIKPFEVTFADTPHTIQKSYTVSDVTELKTVIDSIATDVNNCITNKDNRVDIYLTEGTYDTYSVMNKATMTNGDVPFMRSLEIPDGVNLHGIGDVVLTCTVPESDNSASKNMSTIVSTINVYGSNKIENLTLIANNCRYCVHDDGTSQSNPMAEFSEIEFDNVTFVHNGMVSDTYFQYPQCYGAGYKKGKRGIFRNCYFKNDHLYSLYMHTHSYGKNGSKVFLTVENCVFDGAFDYPIHFEVPWRNKYGADCTVNNCYFVNKKGIKIDMGANNGGDPTINLYGGGNTPNLNIDNVGGHHVYLVN